MKLSDRFLAWIHSKYDKKGLAWERSDDILWKFWAWVAPTLIWIPILFFLMKYFIIDVILKTQGFEKMIAWGIIFMVIRPTIMDALHKILTFKEEIKK
jgi:hypothetical protein